MSVQEAKKRRVEAEAAERDALKEEVDLIEATAIDRYNALTFPGIKTFRLGSDVTDGYCKAVSEIRRQHAPMRLDRMVYVYLKSPVWIAELDNGATVVQCADKGSGDTPTTLERYVVFYNDGPKGMQLPEAMAPMLSASPPPLSFACIAPVRAHSPFVYRSHRMARKRTSRKSTSTAW